MSDPCNRVGLRLEYRNEDENSKKYWEVCDYADGMYTIRYGRIGAQGGRQYRYHEFDLETKIVEKLGKGYVESKRSPVKAIKKPVQKDEHFDFYKELEKI